MPSIFARHSTLWQIFPELAPRTGALGGYHVRCFQKTRGYLIDSSTSVRAKNTGIKTGGLVQTYRLPRRSENASHAQDSDSERDGTVTKSVLRTSNVT
jgi:hypothetical protein